MEACQILDLRMAAHKIVGGQRETDVNSFPQALTCALNTAYPEAAPWTEPVVWTPWMREAAQMVEDDILGSAGGGVVARGWQVRAWLSGPQALAECGPQADHPALCAAQSLYPSADWADPMPWQAELVNHLAMMVPS